MVEADSLAHFTATRKKIGFAHLASPLGIVFHIHPLHLQTKRRFDAGQFHVQPVFNAHRPCVREPWKL
jgi:hypothetical protein